MVVCSGGLQEGTWSYFYRNLVVRFHPILLLSQHSWFIIKHSVFGRYFALDMVICPGGLKINKKVVSTCLEHRFLWWFNSTLSYR